MTPEQLWLRKRMLEMTPAEYKAMAAQVELDEWRAANKFCGRCGTAMMPHPKPTERAFVCPSCGALAYPKIVPAVIVCISKGRQILLQRNSHYKVANWTLVAGFVDPGETFEEAVRREAREEGSIELKDIRYFGSQPWPFPSNMMVGFRAEWAGGELHADGDEVTASGWFEPERLPELPPAGTLARRLVDEWLRESGAEQYCAGAK